MPPKDASTPVTTSNDAPNADKKSEPLPTPELILSFTNLPIPQAEPLIEGTQPPPCPISKISNDVLIEILRHVALMDPASFCRMSLVCRRLAYHFAHEQHIWKRLTQGPEFGFESMYYSFGCDIVGNRYHTFTTRYTPFPRQLPVQIPTSLSSWSQVFQTFPRIRFTGVYISTVNYTRAGAESSYTHATWNSPIHIVTYYRYLRFYPDGTVISLVTTTEPADVVPHISKENAAAARPPTHGHHQHNRQKSESAAPDPTAVVPPLAMNTLKYALRGRWHLTRPTPVPAEEQTDPDQSQVPPSMKTDGTLSPDPRNVVIETEGVDPKYTYVLHLALRSSKPARAVGSTRSPPNVSKNTKLAWKGFWNYNKLTDDWGEFGLRNDRAFVFRRVRGWGLE
jgi:F-box protein 9